MPTGVLRKLRGSKSNRSYKNLRSDKECPLQLERYTIGLSKIPLGLSKDHTSSRKIRPSSTLADFHFRTDAGAISLGQRKASAEDSFCTTQEV